MISILFALLVGLVSNAAADIAPEPGFTRVRLNILIEAKDDFPDFRFFLVSGDMVKEIAIKTGDRTTVGPLGGGARYNAGSVVAIPARDLDRFGENPTGEKLKELEAAIAQDQIAGTIKLIAHSFGRDVRQAEASRWKEPLYRFEKKAEKGITAVLVSGGANENKNDSGKGTFYSTEPKPTAFWTAVVGGSLITLAFIFIGVRLVRRSKTKPAEVGSQQ